MNLKEVLAISGLALGVAFASILILMAFVLPLFVEETINTVEREFENITVGCSSTWEEGSVEIDLNGLKQYCKLRRVLKDGNRLAYYR
jgi:hypothetical protein